MQTICDYSTKFVSNYHYVYRISNLTENKHYYGSRSCSCHPSEDLGIRYFSSSSNKQFILDQKANRSNYRYKIVRICASRENALALEMKFHQRLNVDQNPAFYNQAKLTSTRFSSKGYLTVRDFCGNCFNVPVEDLRIKSGELTSVNSGKIRSAETRRKMSKARMGKPGKPHSDESRRKISEAGVGRTHSDESRRKISEAKKGKTRKPFSETTRQIS